ncbi:MAG: hypothetical protein IPL39_12985 [Opitutaceae bacterium]|nr:hypothetical protein [Opitutaceae bacterium]
MNSSRNTSLVSRGSSASGDLCSDALPNVPASLLGTAPRRQTGAKALLLVSLLASAAAGGLLAQGTPSAQPASVEDVVVLSPFCVASAEDRGYVAASTLAGNRINTELKDVGASISVVTSQFLRDAALGLTPNVPITLIRRADAVVIEFALSNAADKQDGRNKELTDSVDALAAAIKAVPGLRFENREVQLMSGNRQRSLIGKGGVVTSYANFAVFAELGDARLYERVKQVRALVSGSKLLGGTKVIDGPVALYLKRPNDLRKDLLGKIFEDYEVVKKGLGSDFEVLVSGLSGPIKLRSCSENEVELWVDYSFEIRSIREMEAEKK